jgi:ADP-ribosylglycohydrolase
MANDIVDAVYGCLIGGAIGDALGAPVEGWYWHEIRARYGHVTELMPGFGNTGACYGGTTGERYGAAYDGPSPQPGWITDDTTMRHYLCLAIARKQGRVTPDDYRDVLIEVFNPNRVWVNERALIWKLKAGVDPWESGRGAIPAGCATMMIAPVGIINAGNPAQAYQDAWNIAYVNQEGHNRDGAATIAAGVAAAFLPDATVESVLATMAQHSSEYMHRAIELTMDLAYGSDSVDAFAEKYYAKMLDWSWPSPPGGRWNKERFFSGNTVELVPITVAILQLTGGDVDRAMIEAASFGRDCDTTASLAGSLAGALQGAHAIRQDWIETVECANEDFFIEVEGDPKANFQAMARRLVGALEAEHRAAQGRADQLQQLLGLPG